MSINERLDMERQYRDQESTQSRLAGRLKFACCRRCGSADGMQKVHRRTLAEMTDTEIAALASWYRLEPSYMAEYRYYPCPRCNRGIIISRDFVIVSTDEVLEWRNADPMSPDYAALAAEPEQVLASLVDRDSAGLEG